LFPLILSAGLGLGAIALLTRVPAIRRVAAPQTHLDEFMPAWQFNEVHSTLVAASPEVAFAAIHAITAREILFFRTLVAIRTLGLPGPESILRPGENDPVLAIATRTTFRTIANDPPREVVVAMRLGAATEGAMNFSVTPEGDGTCRVTTETRVFATTKAAARKFAIYWHLILPGSDIIRRMWLRAIRLRVARQRYVHDQESQG
jgi:hypothetical protein